MSKERKKEEIKKEAANGGAATEASKKADETQKTEVNEGSKEEASRDLEKELAEAVQAAAENREMLLRVAADFDNFKKRMERERMVLMKYAGEHILKEMLPVVDNLERAVGHSTNGQADTDKGYAALFEGVELTLKSLQNSLEKFEVKPIESIGQAFDPNHMEAMTMEASDTVPANHVITEFEKGYFFKDRLLRAAKVIVSSGKAES